MYNYFIKLNKGVFVLNTLKTTIKWIAVIVVICVVAVFLASINGLTVSRTIASVNDLKVTEAEYKYYLELEKEEMISEEGVTEVEGFWDTEIDGKKASEIVKERAMDELVRNAIAVVKAQEAGITLTDEEKSTASSIVDDKSASAKEQLKALQKQIGANKYQIAEILERTYLANKYYQSVSQQENSPITPDDAKIKEEFEASYASVKHVLILNKPEEETVVAEDGTQAPATLSEEEVAAYKKEAKKKADEVLAKAIAGENFEDLIKEYGEDPGMESSPDGYIIDKYGNTPDGNRMVTEFTKGTFAVKSGEVNPALVESSYGWHIIKRYPIAESSQDYATFLSNATNGATANLFNAYLDSFKESMDIVINEKIVNKIKVK